MQQSANYGLLLFEGTDNVKRQNFVDNFTALDTQLKAINDNSYPDVTATGTNSYIGAADRIQSLGKGTKLTLFVAADATGNCTLNLNSYGDKNIKDSFGNIVNNLKANIPYNLCYNGTDFILQGKGGGGTALPEHLLLNETATTDKGQIKGTMPNQPAQVNAISVGSSGTNKYFRIPNGAYLTNTGSGYPEIVASATQIDSNINNNNIKAGVSICGVAGNSNVVDTSGTTADPSKIISGYNAYVNGQLINGQATIQSLGGRRVIWGNSMPYRDPNSSHEAVINPNLPFMPTIFLGYGSVIAKGAWATCEITYNQGSGMDQWMVYVQGSGMSRKMSYDDYVVTPNKITVGVAKYGSIDDDQTNSTSGPANVLWVAVE